MQLSPTENGNTAVYEHTDETGDLWVKRKYQSAKRQKSHDLTH